MTPSPSPTPTTSPSSRSASSPANTALTEPSRSSFVPPLILPSIPQTFFHPDSNPTPLYSGASGPGRAPVTSQPSTKLPRHGKQKSEDPNPQSSPEASPQAIEEESPVSAGQGGGSSEPRYHGKKKRTRTLTTPHQSAVLHALLAQSRFPTTAMREEVGRSIGLSARKVQVWFQNQRQKARKPRSQSSAPTEHPPQFGPFTPGSSTDTSPLPGPSGLLGSFQTVDPASRQSPNTLETSLSSIHPRGLPAPNPGLSLHSQHYLPEPMDYMTAQPPGQDLSPHRGMPHGVEPTRSGVSSFQPGFFPSQSPHYPAHMSYRRASETYPRHRLVEPPRPESPIILAPLRMDEPRESQFHGSLPPPPLDAIETHSQSDLRRSASFPSVSPSEISTSSTSHLHSPFSASHPPSRYGESIPPPFTLQPAPQWDLPHPGPRLISTLYSPMRSSESPFPRTYTRSRRNSDPTRTLPPLSMRMDEERHIIGPPWPLPDLRSESNVNAGSGAPTRRFDPVHSVVSESASVRMSGESGMVSSRHRHSYNFERASSSAGILPHSSAHDESIPEGHQESDQPS